MNFAGLCNLGISQINKRFLNISSNENLFYFTINDPYRYKYLLKFHRYEITYDFQYLTVEKVRTKVVMNSENIRMFILKEESAFLLYDNTREPPNISGGSNPASTNTSSTRENHNRNSQVLTKFTTFYNSVRSAPFYEN